MQGTMSEDESRAWGRGANSETSLRMYNRRGGGGGPEDRGGRGGGRGGGLIRGGGGAGRGRGGFDRHRSIKEDDEMAMERGGGGPPGRGRGESMGQQPLEE